VYQLCPEFSTPSTTNCVPRLVRNCISCVQNVPASCTLVAFRVVNCTPMICIEKYGYTKYKQFEGSYAVLFYVTVYTIIFTHAHIHIDNVQLLCHVTFWCLSPIETKNIFGEDGRQIMFLISPISNYCYDLMKTLSQGRESLGVSSTWPPTCAHIILIHSAESPLWYWAVRGSRSCGC